MEVHADLIAFLYAANESNMKPFFPQLGAARRRPHFMFWTAFCISKRQTIYCAVDGAVRHGDSKFPSVYTFVTTVVKRK